MKGVLWQLYDSDYVLVVLGWWRNSRFFCSCPLIFSLDWEGKEEKQIDVYFWHRWQEPMNNASCRDHEQLTAIERRKNLILRKGSDNSGLNGSGDDLSTRIRANGLSVDKATRQCICRKTTHTYTSDFLCFLLNGSSSMAASHKRKKIDFCSAMCT